MTMNCDIKNSEVDVEIREFELIINTTVNIAVIIAEAATVVLVMSITS